MKNITVYFMIVFAIIAYTSQADKTSDLQAYPSNKYLVGLSEGSSTVETLMDQAEAQLSKKIFDKVISVIDENEGDRLAYNRVREHYGTVIQSSIRAKLKGIRENYPPKAQNAYLIVYVERDELIEIYSDEAVDLQHEINDIIHKAQVLERAGDLADAAKVYMSTYRLFEALKEAELIQLGALYTIPSKAFSRLVDNAEGVTKSKLMMSHGEVVAKVGKIAPQTVIDIHDVARVTAYQFQQQSSDLETKVKTEELTFNSFNVVSPSSKVFMQALTDELNWHRTPPMRGFQPIQHILETQDYRDPRENQDEMLQFFGGYWEDGDKINLRTILRNIKSGEFIACAIVQFNESQRRDKDVPLKPENLEQFDHDWELFNSFHETTKDVENQEITKTEKAVEPQETSIINPKVITNENISIEIATDKGIGPIIYSKGETMTVFARANQAVYVRLIYILADGRRTLLLKNYHITAEDVNKSIEIGKFVCTPPFGAEQLHVYAKEEPFLEYEKDDIYEEDGYVYLNTTRGFQPLKQKPEGIAHISITTLP